MFIRIPPKHWRRLIGRQWSRHADRWLGQLADFENAPGLGLLCLLGAATGLLGGSAIVILHGLILGLQTPLFSAFGYTDNDFVTASRFFRMTIPIIGAVLLALIVEWRHQAFANGIVHVIERLMYYQGTLPWRLALADLLASSLSIATGQAVGREGVAIHAGAFTGSWFGRRLALPHNSVRTLVGCGTAAGIAASFNTPLAAIIFAMEVIMLEYTIAGFAPIILAATAGSLVTLQLPGVHPGFSIGDATFDTRELPIMVAMGLAIGLVGGCLTWLVNHLAAPMKKLRLSWRIMLAGLITSMLAFIFPQILGLSFGTVNRALAGDYSAYMALGIGLTKMLATFFAITATLPGGTILPLVVAGATLGNAFSLLAAHWAPTLVHSPGLYALLGIGAMLSAVLQAPLFALVMVFELSSQTATVLPGMLVIIMALVVARRIAVSDSVFRVLMRGHGMDYRNDPFSRYMRRVSVLKVMNRNFRTLRAHASRAAIQQALDTNPDWILVMPDKGRYQLMRPDELSRTQLNAFQADPQAPDEGHIDLMQVPGQRADVYSIDVQATLQEAYHCFKETEAEALVVQRQKSLAGLRPRPYGILTTASVSAGNLGR